MVDLVAKDGEYKHILHVYMIFLHYSKGQYVSDSTTTRPRHDWAQPHNNLKCTLMVDLVVKAAVYKHVLHAYNYDFPHKALLCLTLCTHLSVQTQVAGTQNSTPTEGIMYITATVVHKNNSSDSTTTTWPRHTTGHSHTTTTTHNS